MGAAPSDQNAASQSPTTHLRWTSDERKRRFPKLINLRRRLLRSRGPYRTLDHGKVLKDLIENWSTQEITELVDEYEALIAQKDSITQSSICRQPVSSLKKDFQELLENAYCSDVVLLYSGSRFHANKAILSARCSYFKDMFSDESNQPLTYSVDIPVEEISTGMFASLLQYLYTGDFLSQNSGLDSLELLIQLGDDFGTPNVLEQDLKCLLYNADHSDTLLVFQGFNLSELPVDSSVTETCFEVPCHKAVLCARSPYFRSLLLKKDSSFPVLNESGVLKLLLDERVFPRQYARVVLQCMYTDSFDLSAVVKWTSEEERGHGLETHKLLTTAEVAMEVFEVARFIDFDLLAQGCEDIIVEELSPASLLVTLEWSAKPHGSQWVAKQAEQYLLEEFTTIMRSEVFTKIPKLYLQRAIQSDFIQACEQDILAAVIRWGESQVAQRMTALQDSVIMDGKRSVKIKDIDNKALKRELAGLVEHVRVQHIIPPQCEVLENALARGLIKQGMPLDIGQGSFYPRCPWMRRKNDKDFTRPRLFLPYYQEAKSILQERQDAELDLIQQRMLHMGKSIPDTLYMVSNSKRKFSYGSSGPSSNAPSSFDFQAQRFSRKMPGTYCRVQRSNSIPLGEGVSSNPRMLPEPYGLPDIAAEVLIYDPDEEPAAVSSNDFPEVSSSPGPIPDVAASLSSSPIPPDDMVQLDRILGYLNREPGPSPQ